MVTNVLLSVCEYISEPHSTHHIALTLTHTHTHTNSSNQQKRYIWSVLLHGFLRSRMRYAQPLLQRFVSTDLTESTVFHLLFFLNRRFENLICLLDLNHLNFILTIIFFQCFVECITNRTWHRKLYDFDDVDCFKSMTKWRTSSTNGYWIYMLLCMGRTSFSMQFSRDVSV